MRYLILIYGDPTATMDAAESEAEMGKWFTYTQELQAAGAMVAGEALKGPDTATTVRAVDGRVLHTDGPFAETKEVLGGFYLIDVPSLDEALAWAGKIPSVGRGSVEVRPVEDLTGMG
jgi:hypothetical protein